MLVCRLSAARLQLLRNDPGLVPEVRAAIRKREMPGAVDVGLMSEHRRERLAARSRGYGPGAWEALRAVLDGQQGEPLRRDARIVDPAALVSLAAKMPTPLQPSTKGSLASVADALRLLVVEGARAGDALLVLGVALADREESAARASGTAQRQREEIAAERRTARGMSALDERVLLACLHTSGSGLGHPDADERVSFYWDLCDCLYEERQVKALVVDEIKELVLSWAAPGRSVATRRLAALVLAEITTAVGLGGAAAPAVLAELESCLRQLEPDLSEIVSELDGPAAAAIALVTARCGIRNDTVLARVDLPLRFLVRSAAAGDEAAFGAVLAHIADALREAVPSG